MNRTDIQAFLNDFFKRVTEIYGMYYDSCLGLKLALDQVEKHQQNTLKRFKTTNPELASIEYLDTVDVLYGTEPPDKSNGEVLHKATQGYFKERNQLNGLNYQLLGNLCLIAIYDYWEYYRKELSKILGDGNYTIQNDFFGDLRHIRTSIVHHNSIAIPQIKNCKILKWFTPGEPIRIDMAKLDQLVGLTRHIELRILKQ